MICYNTMYYYALVILCNILPARCLFQFKVIQQSRAPLV